MRNSKLHNSRCKANTDELLGLQRSHSRIRKQIYSKSDLACKLNTSRRNHQSMSDTLNDTAGIGKVSNSARKIRLCKSKLHLLEESRSVYNWSRFLGYCKLRKECHIACSRSWDSLILIRIQPRKHKMSQLESNCRNKMCSKWLVRCRSCSQQHKLRRQQRWC